MLNFFLLSFGYYAFLLLLLLLLLLLCLILLIIVVLVFNLLPQPYLPFFIQILLWDLFTDLQHLLPLLLLLFTQNIAFGRLIQFCLRHPVNKAWLACFLAYVYFPHAKLFLSSLIIILVTLMLFLILVVLGNHQVLFLGVLNRCTIQALSLLSYQLMNCHFPIHHHTVSVVFYLLLQF